MMMKGQGHQPALLTAALTRQAAAGGVHILASSNWPNNQMSENEM